MAFNIAIDGPAGAGKSSIAKLVAKKLGIVYVDTGAMYRAMGLYFLRQNMDLKDEACVKEVCKDIEISLGYENGEQQVFLNGENVSSMIRNTEIGNMASKVATIGSVREKLVELQQKIGATTDIIMDGRDICMVVLPGADVKIYLTASAETRARRRFKEYEEKGMTPVFADVLKEVNDRDYNDMHRAVSPLMQAPDAYLLDSSDLTIEQTVDVILNLAKDAGFVMEA